MKKLNKIWGAGLLALSLLLAAPKYSNAQGGGYISDQQFYDDLDPYGTWVSDPQYGDVWVPDAEDGFRPYATRGHWVYTEYGNTWVSDYPWGWATFHYGRWRYDDYYGWVWVPGHEWAPAWVSWRHGGGYYGWAPLQPGISISISIGGGYHVPDNYWVCAPQAYINSPRIYNYYVPRTRSVTIIRNTTIINNTYVNNNRTYIAGPRREDIQRVTHRNVPVYRISNESKPGTARVQNNTVNIYRPAVNKTANARPSRVIDGNAYRQQHPNEAIAHRGKGAPAYNRANAQRLSQTARTAKPDSKIVHVNPAANRAAQPSGRPNPAQQKQQEAAQRNQQVEQQRKQQADQRHQHDAQKNQQQAQQQAKQTEQRRQQAQQRQQQTEQRQQQQAQQRQQQAEQRKQQQAQQRQQQTEQRQQQQAQQRQQQAEQRKQQQAQQRQQQTEQRQQQQAQQRQQQAEQRKQQQAQQRQQQAQQRAQQQAQQRQQQAEQRAQQRAQQRQQQAQQRAQQQAQQRQQQAQQRAQQQQQRAQQRQQQQQRQRPPHHE